MRRLASALLAVCFFCFPIALPGCGSGHQDEVLEYDPELSKKKAAEYEQEMKAAREAAMKNMQKGRPGPGGPYRGRPN